MSEETIEAPMQAGNEVLVENEISYEELVQNDISNTVTEDNNRSIGVQTLIGMYDIEMCAIGSSTPSVTPPGTPRIKLPATQEMVDNAIIWLKKRNGSSMPAIENMIMQRYDIKSPSLLHQNIKRYLKKAVASSRIIQTKRSFKLSPKLAKQIKSATKAVGSAEADGFWKTANRAFAFKPQRSTRAHPMDM